MAGYGIGSWGVDTWGAAGIAPTVTSAVSLDGFRIEVTFSEDMQSSAAFYSPSSYFFTPFWGGAPVTTISVIAGTIGPLGPRSAVITHTGTTFGGFYRTMVVGLKNAGGTAIDPANNYADILTRGDEPTYTATATAGNKVVLQFSQNMLSETTVSPGIEQVSAYSFEHTPPAFPIPLTLQSVSHPYTGDLKKVELTVQGMTSIWYDSTVGVGDAIRFDGTYLPSTSTTFLGVELGLGTTTVVVDHLLLSKNSGSIYGWGFIDTSGRLTGTSTVRDTFVFDVSVGSFGPPAEEYGVGAWGTSTWGAGPPGEGHLGTYSFSDGATQIDVRFEQVGGIKKITVQSGFFYAQVDADWGAGPTELCVVRNQLADTYTIGMDGAPLVSGLIAAFTGSPSILGGNPGTQFTLAADFDVVNFSLSSVDLTSTETIFGHTWNFVHSSVSMFLGSAVLASDHLYTDRGPLVKGWGDATPATTQDVAVFVNSLAYTWIDSVNPYTGKITFSIPIPFMPPGTTTVEVDYIWFANPVFPFAGFNTDGLVFNKWDRRDGMAAYPPAHGEQIQTLPAFPKGYTSTSRFPFSATMGPWSDGTPQPLLIGHRYLGLVREYSATFNNPTTLLFNQNPHSSRVRGFALTPPPVSEAFEGVRDPQFDDPPWILEGSDTGVADAVTGIYTLKDESTGTFGTGQAAFYQRDADFSFPSSVVMAARFEVSEFTVDGVYTGISFGMHDNRRLYLVGLLYVNGVRHVGMLKDPGRLQEISSWDVGPTTAIEILNSTTYTAQTSDIPTDVGVGTRFQIFTGSQAGVYTIKTRVDLPNGTSTVTVDDTISTFPADPQWWGNRYYSIHYEILWSSNPSTYRMVVEPEQALAQLLIGGAISAEVLTFDSAPDFPIPPDTTLMLNTTRGGQIFWGSLSREATNTSLWSFFRYGVLPDQTTLNSRGHIVSSEMTATPDDDANSEWFEPQDFGYAEVDSTGNQILLKSTSGSDTLDLVFGYKRIEPFLRHDTMTDVDGKFKVESGVLDSGDATVRIWDTQRDIRLATLLYTENPLEPYNFRNLIRLPAISLSCLYKPSEAGWVSGQSTDVSEEVRQHRLMVSVPTGSYYTNVYGPLAALVDDVGSRILEARFAVESYTYDPVQGDTGIYIAAECGGVTGVSKVVGLTLWAPHLGIPAKVVLVDPIDVAVPGALFPIQDFDFDWTDGAQHTYRVLMDDVTDTVTLVIDDQVQVPTVDINLFGNTVDNKRVSFGNSNYLDTSSTIEWHSVSYQSQPPWNAMRTLGIWLGGDPTDINNWELPRTDSNNDPNRWITASVEPMDWSSDIEFRLRKDPGWGVTLFRPDLPVPPFYTGDFATKMTEPSAGWINVSSDALPTTTDPFGGVAFGALDPRSITQQRWDYVRYRVYKPEFDEFIEPRYMVFNQYGVISSGELENDVTPEQVTVRTIDQSTVSLIPANIFANRIFVITDGSTVFVPDQFTFRVESQTVFLKSGHNFSGDHILVDITFAPGKPVTKTYLEGQPLLASTELVNEGTPAYLRHLTSDPERKVVFGSVVTDPDGDFIDNTPYQQVEFEDRDTTVYENMAFFDVDNGGVRGFIEPFCDSSFPEHGLSEMGLEGELLTEHQAGAPKNKPFEFPDHIKASGGSFEDGVLGPIPVAPGTEIMFPNQQASGVRPGTQTMGLNQSVQMIMIDGGVVVLKKEW